MKNPIQMCSKVINYDIGAHCQYFPTKRRYSAAASASARCSENMAAAVAPDPNDSERSACPIGAVGISRLGVEGMLPPEDEVIWWKHNWRKGGLQERRLQIIKEYDFYNQQYCGCEFSMRKEDVG